VLGEKQREAELAGQPLDQRDGLARLAGRHAGGGLVQQQDFRLQRQREPSSVLSGRRGRGSPTSSGPGRGDPPPEYRLRLIGVETLDPLEEVPAAPAMGHIGGLHVLEHGERGKMLVRWEGAPHAEAAGIVRRYYPGDVLPLEDDLAVSGADGR